MRLGFLATVLMGMTVSLQPSAAADVKLEQHLARVTTNAVKGSFDFRAMLDPEGNLKGLRIYQPGKRAVFFEFNAVRRGVTTLKKRIRKLGLEVEVDITRLHGPRLSRTEGGAVSLVFLHDWITSDYRVLPLEIQRDGNTWTLYLNHSTGRVPVEWIHLNGYKTLGQPRGIQDLLAFSRDGQVARIKAGDLKRD